MPSDLLELFAKAQDGVYAVDMNQRVVFWNRGAERILGYRAEEILGKRCYQVFAGVSEKEAQVCTNNCFVILWARKGIVAPAQTIRTQTKDGQSKWLNITHVLLPAAKRELSILVHILNDVTEAMEAKRLVQRVGRILAKAPQVPISAYLPALEVRDGVETLSPRELEVLRLLASGLGTTAIAETLVVSQTTVRNHIQHILSKLGVHNRLEAVAASSRHGML